MKIFLIYSANCRIYTFIYLLYTIQTCNLIIYYTTPINYYLKSICVYHYLMFDDDDDDNDGDGDNNIMES